jgi:uncharacterized membrane protein YhfC
MKKKVPMPIVSIIMIVSLITINIGVIFFLRGNQTRYKEELKALSLRNVNGTIIYLKNEHRGSYYIEIECPLDTVKQHSLPLSWVIEDYGIKIGDRVTKKANSKIMSFFKEKNNTLEKICEFELDL